MSNRDDQGGGSPPGDDRTLLDPLSNEELEALRKARQRVRGRRGEEARQVVLGPEDDPNVGEAPTRATPALPSFEGRVSLDQIGSDPEAPTIQPHEGLGGAGQSVYSATIGPGAEDPTLMPGRAGVPMARGTVPSAGGGEGGHGTPGPLPSPGPGLGVGGGPRTPAAGSAPAGPTGGPAAGRTGFGENTLMWMQPPAGGAAPRAASDILPAPSPRAVLGHRIRTYGLLGVLLAVTVAVVVSLTLAGDNGVIELRTTPSGAAVAIDGKLQSSRTPVQVTMAEGPHVIELSLDGYAPRTLDVVVDPDEPTVKSVDLEPVSAPRLMTVVDRKSVV